MNYYKSIFYILDKISNLYMIYPILPTKEDGNLSTFLKYSLAVKMFIDSNLHEEYYKDLILKSNKLNKSKSNYLFVKMLTESNLFKTAKLQVEPIGGPKVNFSFSKRRVSELKTIFIDSYNLGVITKQKADENYGTFNDYDSKFYFNENLDFNKLSDRLWQENNNAVYIYKKQNKSRYLEVSFCPLIIKDSNIRTNKSFCNAKHIYDNHISQTENSTYLLFGPPGTGKTSLVSFLCNHYNSKILKIDATIIASLAADEFEFITDTLMPDFIIIDDYDRIEDKDVSKLLFFFERLKTAKSNITTIITVNDFSKLDKATLRSGRIDEVIEVGLPDKDERQDLISKLLEKNNLDESLLSLIVESTNEFCHADIIAFVEKLQYFSFETVNSNINKLRELAK